MKIFTHNFDPRSNSGPNKFTRQMLMNLLNKGLIETVVSQSEADLEFALISQGLLNKKPLVLRLDGIYFNIRQNRDQQNAPIRFAYKNASHVIFQSKFNKTLTEKWWGPARDSSVIHNGADRQMIDSVDTSMWDKILDKDVDLWSCASSWRPHKRLEENLRYFVEKSQRNSLMAVAGKNADIEVIEKWNKISRGRIRYLGDLDYYTLVSLYKRSSNFIHLAFLDHCPNVVVDAQAAGCHVTCSSAGGTSEIVTKGTIVEDIEWDFEPIDLYDPPVLNFDKTKKIDRESMPDIDVVSSMYFDRFESII